MSRPDGLGCVAGTLCVGGPVPTDMMEMYTAKECAGWRADQWGYNIRRGRSPINDVFSHATNSLVDFNVTMLFHSHGCEENYLRIQAMVVRAVCSIHFDSINA